MKRINQTKGKAALPDYIATDMGDINFEHLQKMGIKACFFDLDHTILHHGTYQVSDVILKHLSKVDIKLYIATNRRYDKQLDEIAKQINAKGVMHADKNGIHKPRRAYYQQMTTIAGVAPDSIVMVGDRLIQDIWGANRAGVRSVMVEKLGPIKWWDRILIIPDKIIPLLFRWKYTDV